MNSASSASPAAQTHKFLTMIKLLSESVMTQQLPSCSKCDSVQVPHWPLTTFNNCLSICWVGLSHPLAWELTPCELKMGLDQLLGAEGWLKSSCASPSSTLSVPLASTHHLYQQSDAVPLPRAQLHFGKAPSLYWLPWAIQETQSISFLQLSQAPEVQMTRPISPAHQQTLRCDTALCRDRIYTQGMSVHHTQHTGNPFSWILSVCLWVFTLAITQQLFYQNTS